MSSKSAIFLINLLQDVNIARPLIYMATRDFKFETVLLVSSRFLNRDLFGIWQTEIDHICSETGATLKTFEDDMTACQIMADRAGIIFAASESHLSPHSVTHNAMRYAPPGLLRVTLQHGFECVGFRHSTDHAIAYGKTASFAADMICSWTTASTLSALSPIGRNKLLVTGPTAILQQPAGPLKRRPDAPGIVCENLHSVRLNIAGDFRTQFVDAFGEFCTLLQRDGQSIVLRPHPGGQYVLKNNVPIPANATINNAPMYRLDLRQFAYGISAPSSVLIDMLLADIPTAVWKDGSGEMDSSAYAGLVEISTPQDWIAFSQEATRNPEPILERQRQFLDDQQMPLDPADVYRRFADLFQAAIGSAINGKSNSDQEQRILFVANALIPTLQLSFIKPLTPLAESGRVEMQFLTEQSIKEQVRNLSDGTTVFDRIETFIREFDPTIITFCRYSGPHYKIIDQVAKERDVPLVYHIDDDLLNIPMELGEAKYRFHNDPARLNSVKYCIESADLVYCSTKKLKHRLQSYFPNVKFVDGRVYCTSLIISIAEHRPTKIVGYMGFDHAHDLQSILPALVVFLRNNRHVVFELFGSIPKPQELEEFGSRIVVVPPVRDYAAFLNAFAARQWDIGICPLVNSDFNLVKADTKWVEYTAVGAAVIASGQTVYEACCEGGCGILVQTHEEWISALQLLTDDSSARYNQVTRAQRKLSTEYNVRSLQTQVLDIFDRATKRARNRSAHANEQEVV